MNVTLISPYPDLYAIGMRILSACLKQRGHRVRLIFLPESFGGLYRQAVLDEVASLAADSGLIGISLMTDQFHKAVQITRVLKQRLQAPLLWGGVHPTVSPEECLEYADMICLGEGEEALLELADKQSRGEELGGTRNIWSKKEGVITRSGLRPLIQDLDSIPPPDYELDDHFVLSEGHILKMNAELLEKHYRPYYITIPSRGCPFSCTYCCNNRFNKLYAGQRVVRKKRLENIILELEAIRRKLPFLSEIWFDDDSFFTYSEEEIEDFSAKYKTRVSLPLRIGGATPTTISRNKLGLLVEAGLSQLRMGIQTGSECTKSLYRRRHTNPQVVAAVKMIHEFRDKLLPTYDVILDNPWETEDDLVETLRFLAGLPAPFRLMPFSLVFYPGTELFDRAVQEGLISRESKYYLPRVYYHCKKTHWNRLFYLLDKCAAEGSIPTRVFMALTNQRLRRWHLHRLLFVLFLRWRRAKELARKLREAVAKGDWARIGWFFSSKLKKPAL